MSIKAKICGLNHPAAVAAAVAGGASHVGFVFYPPSPRSIDPLKAASLAAGVPAGIVKVGLFVDASDEDIVRTLGEAPLDMLQLHGDETPRRVKDVRRKFGKPVMKALRVASAADIAAADEYLPAVDWLLFDAKPPPEMKNALPGGNAISFDWSLIAGRGWSKPWMLSGGLNVRNLADAVRITGAKTVDVSSGVEDSPGRKNPEKIAAFLKLAASL
ncbi:MAG TPA: phosphoribosylanthranilate isomerase [Candidatus Polarisedimenticolia bacterium]|jgi:phosphoribosylanthranilate isomerase|nr:phosphoribosylanthranilate isomerase [Dongiaceae bacterium]HYV89988.1 phosphoribosylanthranilate isomerase [Candidatus Polarisedimenticolia bacterium]